MDKKTIASIVVTAVSLLFITELFYGSGWFTPSSGSGMAGKNVTGTAVFSGVIRTYDPMLFIALDTNQSVLQELRAQEAVIDIQAESSAYVVRTETRDDVYPLAEWLRARNVSSAAIANIAPSDIIEVETPAGVINATLNGGAVRVATEPLMDADSPVRVSMFAVVQGSRIISYDSASLLVSDVDLALDALIESSEGDKYTYSIPWEARDSLGDLSRFERHDYQRVDSILFVQPLDVSSIMIKKQFPYIVYIDAYSAMVAPSFTDASAIATNFADTPYTLPQSSLTIWSNEAPDLNFTPTSLVHRYRLTPLGAEYDFTGIPLVFETSRIYAINDTVRLNATVSVVGERVVALRRVSLPS